MRTQLLRKWNQPISFRACNKWYRKTTWKKLFFPSLPLESLKWPNGLIIIKNGHNRNCVKVLKIEFFLAATSSSRSDDVTLLVCVCVCLVALFFVWRLKNATLQICNFAALPLCNFATLQLCSVRVLSFLRVIRRGLPFLGRGHWGHWRLCILLWLL